MDTKNERDKVKLLLATHLGLDVSDIKEDDAIADDLHMTPADLADFTTNLENQGYDISNVKLEELETVEDLVDSITG